MRSSVLCLLILKTWHPEKEPNALVDLSLLLTTRKSSEALGDFFGSGDLMSERVPPVYLPAVGAVLIHAFTEPSEMGVECHGGFVEVTGLLLTKTGSCLSTSSYYLTGGLRVVSAVSFYLLQVGHS